jgi:hypothetical protein
MHTNVEVQHETDGGRYLQMLKLGTSNLHAHAAVVGLAVQVQ